MISWFSYRMDAVLITQQQVLRPGDLVQCFITVDFVG